MRTAGSSDAVETHESVTEDHAVTVEYLMNALRLLEGTRQADFAAATGIDPTVVAQALQSARDAGLLEPLTDRLCATPTGIRRLNEILRLV